MVSASRPHTPPKTGSAIAITLRRRLSKKPKVRYQLLDSPPNNWKHWPLHRSSCCLALQKDAQQAWRTVRKKMWRESELWISLNAGRGLKPQSKKRSSRKRGGGG